MQENNIDIGIDLGTTNSVIAIMQQGTPFVQAADPSKPITPSVVRITRNGAMMTGNKAAGFLVADPENTVGGFKRRMGTAHIQKFTASGREMTAPQLSAVILQSLRNDVQQYTDGEISAAVITVPAAFDLNQCAATQEAATLAGITQAPLLQEPIAASLAYGYRVEMEGNHWLVYDAGGGTFDLALVGVQDGRIQVLDHEGDNYLGGTDLDWLIAERILIPQLGSRFNLKSFSRANPDRRSAFQILKGLAETAKIELSRSESTIVQIETLRKPMLDDDGREIEADIAISREEYETLTKQFVDRTVTMSRSVLQRHPDFRVAAVLMVGGPTLTPVLRRAVAAGLDVPVNTAANPLTVVAEGAAIYAATQPLERRGVARPITGALTLDVAYKSVTDDDSIPVGCRVPPSVAMIEYVAADRSWSSGQLPIAGGRVLARLPLPQKGMHNFEIIARSADGTVLACEPRTIGVMRGLTAAAPPLSKSLGVVLEDGSGSRMFEVIIPKGTALPVRRTYEVRTIVALEPGGELETIIIHVLEGENPRSERNRRVGRIEITDRRVPRKVPAGNPLEITVEVDASRRLAVSAYLPIIDQSFRTELTLGADEPDPAEIRSMIAAERERLAGLAQHLPAGKSRSLHDGLSEAEQDTYAASGGMPEMAQRAFRNLQRLQADLDLIEDSQELPIAVADARQVVSWTTRVVMEFGDDSHRVRLHTLVVDLDEAVEVSSVPDIKRSQERIDRLRFEILAQQPRMWIAWFNQLCDNTNGWTDNDRAVTLMRHGRLCVVQEEFDELRQTFFKLLALRPPSDAERLNPFRHVGIRRA